MKLLHLIISCLMHADAITLCISSNSKSLSILNISEKSSSPLPKIMCIIVSTILGWVSILHSSSSNFSTAWSKQVSTLSSVHSITCFVSLSDCPHLGHWEFFHLLYQSMFWPAGANWLTCFVIQSCLCWFIFDPVLPMAYQFILSYTSLVILPFFMKNSFNSFPCIRL